MLYVHILHIHVCVYECATTMRFTSLYIFILIVFATSDASLLSRTTKRLVAVIRFSIRCRGFRGSNFLAWFSTFTARQNMYQRYKQETKVETYRSQNQNRNQLQREERLVASPVWSTPSEGQPLSVSYTKDIWPKQAKRQKRSPRVQRR